MNNLAKRIEFIANLSIIIVAILLSSVLIKNHLFTNHKIQNTNPVSKADTQVQKGTKISLPDVDWQKHEQTLLLALSTTCRYCSESNVFYQQLTKERSNNTGIIAILPQSIEESKKYLESHGVSVDEIKQARLDSIGVSSTPTVILVDSSGTVKDSWIGKLLKTDEAQVLSQVKQSIAQR